MSKLLGFVSTVALIGALLCFAVIKIPVSGYVSEAQSFMPLLLMAGIGAAVGSFFLKAVWRFFSLAVIAILLALAYFGLLSN